MGSEESSIREEMERIKGVKWMQRRYKQLEAQLNDLTSQPPILAEQPSTGGGPVPGRAMLQVYGPKTVRQKLAPPQPTEQCTPYGTMHMPPVKKCKREVSDSDEEDDGPEEALGQQPARDAAPRMDLDGEDFCGQCNVPMRLVPARAIMVCTQCGYKTSYIDATSNSMAYGEELDFAQQYSYRRVNHWKLAVAQLQALENAEIKQDVLNIVLEELYARGVTEVAGVTPQLLREILKKKKLRRCYDHIPQIHSRITGVAPIRFTSQIEEKLRLMFIAIQVPFSKAAPVDRKNFLSYKYLLHKVAELCGFDEILQFLSLLKGKDKLLRQDAIYKSICQQLNWQFIPSI
jgi:hypothetical protein